MRSLIILSLLCSISFGYARSGADIIRDNGFKTEVSPMLTTEWSQDGGENALLPIIGGEHAVTGCGVTATAQVMKYWSIPTYGIGENYYIWNNHTGGKDVLYADFASIRYDWDNMIDRYKGNPSASPEEIKAVATLMRDLGVALQVKYESTSTATNIEYISTVLKKYYGYNPNMTIHRYVNGAYSIDEWLEILYSELSAGRPVIMGGSYAGANHIYVADGYDTDGKIHLNLGKANIGGSINTNGYFDLTRTGETYTSEMRMLTGIAPYPFDTETRDFHVATAGTLKDVLGGDKDSRKLCRIKLSGNLNEADFEWLQTLSAITTGQLSYIDMSEAQVEGNRIPDGAFTDSYTLQEILLPASATVIAPRAFRNANGLWKVTLPESLTELGDYAFSGCRYLDSLSFPTSLQKIGSNPMRYVHLSTMDIAPGNKHFQVHDGALYSKNNQILYAMPMITSDTYTVSEGVRKIGTHAFSMQLMIPTVRLPSSLTEIGKWAFYECLGLKDIFISATMPPDVGEDAFSYETLQYCTLHIPVGTKPLYLNSDWSRFANIIEDESITSLADIEFQPTAPIEVYDLTGRYVSHPKQGNIYIIRRPDGIVNKTIYQQ